MVRFSTILMAAVLLVMVLMLHPFNRGVGHAYDPSEYDAALLELEAEAIAVSHSTDGLQASAARGLQAKIIDLPAVQEDCRAQTDQHYQDCVTVNQVLDALAGDCEDCRPELEYFTSSETGRVIAIELVGIGLAGSIPPEIGDLAALESLSLGSDLRNERYNYLTGSIPSEIGDLANLRRLVLPINNLTGSIPPELGNLAALESLFLSNNNLTGPIPPELGSLAALELADSIQQQPDRINPSGTGQHRQYGLPRAVR